MDQRTSWISGEPMRSPFVMPTGLSGRLAGRIMLWLNRRQSLEVRDVLDIQPGEQVLEVGYGPGGLVSELRAKHPERIRGVDPSPIMRRQAARLNRVEVSAGRVDLQVGTAERTGFADAEFDCVVSVNNVPMWSDLEVGVRELHRVTRSGGRVVVAWHGGTNPSRIARRMRLSEDTLQRIETAMGDVFTTVQRRELSTLTVFIGRN